MGTQNGHVKGDPKSKIPANQKVITQTNSSTNDSVEVAPKRIRKMYNAAGFAYSNLVSMSFFLIQKRAKYFTFVRFVVLPYTFSYFISGH